jgi:TolB-like protein
LTADPAEVGRFRILRRLGEGGMGVVYVGYDEALQRDVAIKLLRVDGAAQSQSLLREARIAARIAHPSICTIHEVGEHDGIPFLVMELLEGETVAARLAAGVQDPYEACSVMIPTLDGLEALHAAGLVHLDVKPANIFITPHGVKLLDFGLARGFSPGGVTMTRSVSGMWAGTPAYMSPEQVRGDPVDARSDVFAAGIVLFELVTGQSAFRGATFVDILQAVLTEHPPALSGSAALVAVDRVIQRALAKNAPDRYHSAGDMAAALRAVGSLPNDGGAVQIRRVKRVAVLPFRLLRPDAEIEYLRVGLADALGSSLAAAEGLVVRSVLALPPDVAASDDAGRAGTELDADLILTGTLLRSGARVRVSAQLIEVGTGHAKWSQQADGTLEDLFELQDGLAARILGSLPFAVKLSRPSGEVPRNEVAYSLYLQANQLAQRPQTWIASRSLYRESVSVDPRFAPSWAGLGRLERVLAKYQVDAEAIASGYDAAETALRRAVELSPDLPQAHYHYAQLEADLGRTEDALRRLLRRLQVRRTDPEIYAGLVLVCRYCGLFDASIAAHESARTLDPQIKTSISLTRLAQRDFDGVLASAHDELDTDARIIALEGLDRRNDAIELARTPTPFISGDDPAAPMRRALLAYLEGATADAIAALHAAVGVNPADDRSLPRFPDGEDVFWTARFYTRLGRPDLGLAGFRAAVDQGYFCVAQFEQEPWLDAIRSESAFSETMAIARQRQARAVEIFTSESGPRLLGVVAAAV